MLFSVSPADVLIAVVSLFVGVGATAFFGRRYLRSRLAHALDFDRLIDPSEGIVIEDLLVTVHGDSVRRVSRTYLAIWHRIGNPILPSQLSEKDPLRLQLEDGDTPLQVRVLYMSDPAVEFGAVPKGNSVELTFSVLDKGDGALVEVLHQGQKRPRLRGRVNGATLDASRRRQDLALTKGILDLYRSGSPARSAIARSWRRARESRSSAFAAAIVALGITALCLGVAFSIYAALNEPHAHVVSLRNFNLRTVAGQKAFAAAVRNQTSLWPLAGFFTFLLVAFIVAFGWVIWHAPIPRRILRYDPSVERDRGEAGSSSNLPSA